MHALITPRSFHAELVRVVERYGADHVYSSPHGCRYVIDGKPSCLIGHALWAFSPQWAESGDVGKVSARALIERMPAHLFGSPEDRLMVAYAAEGAQVIQDDGGTWGEALDRYERRLRHRFGIDVTG